jgi:hypothetical protein
MSQCERKANAPVAAKAFSVHAVPRVAAIAAVEKRISIVLFGPELSKYCLRCPLRRYKNVLEEFRYDDPVGSQKLKTGIPAW